jgi:negative regulator of genetic competence, sporulation and motility
MADSKDKKEELQKGVPVPERGISAVDRETIPDAGIEKNSEKAEKERESRIVLNELRQEIDTMELDDKAKAEAEKKAEKIEFLGEKEKIEHLLQMARDRGLVFAIQVARKMNEPYLLDILHDTLAQEGFYKDFIKRANDDDNKP